MFTYRQEVAIPDELALARLNKQSWYLQNPLQTQNATHIMIPSTNLRELGELWSKGPTEKVSSKVHWLDEHHVTVFQHESPEGFVYISAKYFPKLKQTLPGIRVFDTEEDIAPLFQWFVTEPDHDLHPDDKAYLEECWVKMIPAVNQLKSAKKVRPNDPCPCGKKKPNGKPIKAKHCNCGVF